MDTDASAPTSKAETLSFQKSKKCKSLWPLETCSKSIDSHLNIPHCTALKRMFAAWCRWTCARVRGIAALCNISVIFQHNELDLLNTNRWHNSGYIHVLHSLDTHALYEQKYKATCRSCLTMETMPWSFWHTISVLMLMPEVWNTTVIEPSEHVPELLVTSLCHFTSSATLWLSGCGS